MSSDNIWDIAIATIFAREFMEGAIIVGEFRTAIIRSEESKDENAPTKQQLLKCVTCSAFWAAVCAVAVILIVAIPLAVLGQNLSEKAVELIEGISKIIAAFAILILSLKIPKWLGGFYKNKKKGKVSEGFDLDLKSVRFNVSWNIWREMAECGAFLLPAFLSGDQLKAIPLSAFVGIIIGLLVGGLIYWANRVIKRKMPLTIFITLLLVFLATGLFVGGCHEFEEVYGETKDVWAIENENMSHKKLPMAIFKPFGYSSSRTVLQICCFWCFLFFSACCHGFMIWRTKKINRELAAAAASEGENGDIDDVQKNAEDTLEVGSGSDSVTKDVEAGNTTHESNTGSNSDGKPEDELVEEAVN